MRLPELDQEVETAGAATELVVHQHERDRPPRESQAGLVDRSGGLREDARLCDDLREREAGADDGIHDQDPGRRARGRAARRERRLRALAEDVSALFVHHEGIPSALQSAHPENVSTIGP